MLDLLVIDTAATASRPPADPGMATPRRPAPRCAAPLRSPLPLLAACAALALAACATEQEAGTPLIIQKGHGASAPSATAGASASGAGTAGAAGANVAGTSAAGAQPGGASGEGGSPTAGNGAGGEAGQTTPGGAGGQGGSSGQGSPAGKGGAQAGSSQSGGASASGGGSGSSQGGSAGGGGDQAGSSQGGSSQGGSAQGGSLQGGQAQGGSEQGGSEQGGSGQGGAGGAGGPCPPDMVAIEDFCIDRYEAPNQLGALPLAMQTALDGEAWCGERGKRLCTEAEWLRACEGTAKTKYPYGSTYEEHRCNDDKTWISPNWGTLATWPSSAAKAEAEKLYQGDPSGDREGCVSAEGVHDLTGNVAEWVARSYLSSSSYEHVLKGCYWSKCYGGSNPSCTFVNGAHPGGFRTYEAGFRCCQDAP